MNIQPVGDVVLVTGAGQGMGRAIALAFAREGVAVAVNDVDLKTSEETVAMVAGMGGRAMAVCADVSSQSEVQDMVAKVQRDLGPIDIMINNAGISPKKEGTKVPIWEMDLSEWERVVQINLTGQWVCSRAVVRGMIERRKGVIINTSSVAGTTYTDIAGCHYHATKAGVEGLTRALAGELGRFGIRVCAVAPGRIRTELAMKAPKEINDRILSHIPLGVWGEPEDVGNLMLFLSSSAAAHITGATVFLDGGWVNCLPC